MTLLELLLRNERTTIVELAREVGATPHGVTNWLRGRYRPSPIFARALERHFGVPIDNLLADFELLPVDADALERLQKAEV